VINMGIENQIQEDLKIAMKAGDKVRVNTLRLIRSQFKNALIAGRGKDPLKEEDFLAILSKEAKKRKESIVMYSDGGRKDLAAQEALEFDIISAYLPQQLGKDELEEIIKNAIKKTGADSLKDMGRVMGVIMPQIKGRADGGQAQILVKSLLS